MRDPAITGAVVLGVMGFLIGVLTKGVELAGLLFLLAMLGTIFLGSGGAVAGGLLFIPFSVWLLADEERLKSFLGARLSSPCMVLAVALSRALPWRIQSFLRYAQDALLLKRTGAELEFSHRILRDHFATRDLLQGLATADGEEKLRMIQGLGTQGEAALDVLASFLEEEDPRLREGAVRSICRIRSEDSPLYLRPILIEDPSPKVRAAALDAIGRLPSVEDFAARASRDRSPIVRAAVLECLPRIEESEKKWAAFLSDPASEVVRAALAAAGQHFVKLSTHRRLQGKDVIIWQQRNVIRDPPPELALHLSAEAQRLVVSFGRSSDFHVRRACSYALRYFRSPEAITALSILVRDEDRVVRIAAAESLGWQAWQATPAALSALKRTLGRGSQDLRVTAVIAIGKVVSRLGATPDGEELLLRLTRDSNAEVRSAAYTQLPRALRSEPTPHLVRGLEDPKIKVRLACLSALGELQGPAPPELIAAFHTRSLSLEAAEVLVSRRDRSVGATIFAALGSRWRWQRLSAVLAAGGLLLEDTVPALETLQQREQRWWPRCCSWFESRLVQALPRLNSRRRLKRQIRLGELARCAADAILSGDRKGFVSYYQRLS